MGCGQVLLGAAAEGRGALRNHRTNTRSCNFLSLSRATLVNLSEQELLQLVVTAEDTSSGDTTFEMLLRCC